MHLVARAGRGPRSIQEMPDMEFPPELLLRPSPKKAVVILALGGAFFAGGVLMLLMGDAWGWLGIVMGVGGELAGAMRLLPNSFYLRITADGFTMCSMFRQHTYRWADVEWFRVVAISGAKMVGFDYSTEYRKSKNLRALNRELAGVEGGIPDQFSMSPQELAALLNEAKARATSQQPPPS